MEKNIVIKVVIALIIGIIACKKKEVPLPCHVGKWLSVNCRQTQLDTLKLTQMKLNADGTGIFTVFICSKDDDKPFIYKFNYILKDTLVAGISTPAIKFNIFEKTINGKVLSKGGYERNLYDIPLKYKCNSKELAIYGVEYATPYGTDFENNFFFTKLNN